MNKKELAERVANDLDISTSLATHCVQAFEHAITEELAQGREVRLPGFGTFSVTIRAARTGRNPRTGVTIDIPAQRVARFAPGKALKEVVNG